jgi:hypothetical protein
MERGKFRRVRNGMDCSEESPLFLKTISKKLDFRKTGREVSAPKKTKPPELPPGGERREGGWMAFYPVSFSMSLSRASRCSR